MTKKIDTLEKIESELGGFEIPLTIEILQLMEMVQQHDEAIVTLAKEVVMLAREVRQQQ